MSASALKDQDPLHDILDEMPADARESFRKGFAIASRFSHDQLARAVKIGASAGSPDPTTRGAFTQEAKELGLTIAEFQDLRVLLFVGGAAGLIATNDEALREVLDSLAARKLIVESERSFTANIVNLCREFRQTFGDILGKEELGNRTLPSLTNFGFSIDVRVAFDKDRKVTRAVPIAVVSVDTDGENQVLWFQLTRNQAASLALRLRAMVAQMDAAADWIPGEKRSQGSE
jgi:hypothetical protein